MSAGRFSFEKYEQNPLKILNDVLVDVIDHYKNFYTVKDLLYIHNQCDFLMNYMQLAVARKQKNEIFNMYKSKHPVSLSSLDKVIRYVILACSNIFQLHIDDFENICNQIKVLFDYANLVKIKDKQPLAGDLLIRNLLKKMGFPPLPEVENKENPNLMGQIIDVAVTFANSQHGKTSKSNEQKEPEVENKGETNNTTFNLPQLVDFISKKLTDEKNGKQFPHPKCAESSEKVCQDKTCPNNLTVLDAINLVFDHFDIGKTK